MSDKAISVGDLVMVVRSPCCGHELGKTGKVTSIGAASLSCSGCREIYSEVIRARFDSANRNGQLWAYPLAWLKRIDPMSEPESTETERELTV